MWMLLLWALLIVGVQSLPLACEHGFFPESHATPYCHCDDGWGGIGCSICRTDDVCPASRPACDRSVMFSNDKAYECAVQDADMVEIIGDRFRLSCQPNGTTCAIEAWGTQNPTWDDPDPDPDAPTAYARTFRCILYNVSSVYDFQTQQMIAHSQGSFCTCDVDDSERCTMDFLGMTLAQMLGPSSVACGLYDHRCVVHHSDFIADIELVCEGGGCLREALPYPSNSSRSDVFVFRLSWQGVIVDLLTLSFIGLVSLWVHLVCLACCVSYARSVLNMRDHTREHGGLMLELSLPQGYYAGRCGCGCTKKSERCIFHPGTHVRIYPGITAVLGASGDGKTRLLSLLANHDMRGRRPGMILKVNDTDIRRCRHPSVAERYANALATMDSAEHPLDGLLTVYENALFSATTRFTARLPHLRKRVERSLRRLGLEEAFKRVVGGAGRSVLSNGQRKRLALAMQLAANPAVLLADECMVAVPAAMQRIIFRELQETCAERMHEGDHQATYVVSMHEPPDDVLLQTDHIVVVARKSVVLQAKTQSVANSLNKRMPADDEAQGGSLAETIRRYADAMAGDINEGVLLDTQASPPGKRASLGRLPQYGISLAKQGICLVLRDLLRLWRSPWNALLILAASLVMGGGLSGLYYQQDDGIAGSQNRMGFLLYLCLFLGLTSLSSVWLFDGEEAVRYTHEVRTGTYHRGVYFATRWVTQFVLYRLPPPLLLSTMTYWAIGLHEGRFGWFVVTVVLVALLSDLTAVILGLLLPSAAAVFFFAISVSLNVLSSGLVLNAGTLPGWLQPLSYLSFWKLAYGDLMINEFQGLQVTIDPKGFPSFRATGEFYLSELDIYPSRFELYFVLLLVCVVVYLGAAWGAFRCCAGVRK